ncbi:amidohydrolase family protein [Roseateles saccharophilus]|uniref:Mannonate dehydratase n=1 Tax=Roseateles saccharophilus TaxID=304 RepID=A0A4V2VS53_ROSSA|nr:amidohydrolase family protein [Roseateles saccharophilus]MDG0835586.1 amidohydrolase [Roseateles saccharophilus]TCV01050.1 mannonate dehydratase [Roseateles saccharophilus]
MLTRRHLLCCGAAAGLFTSLAGPARAGLLNQCRGSLPDALRPLVERAFDGIDPPQLWDVHTHLLGTGDSGSGCSVNAQLSQWWHPVEMLRKRLILNAACVPSDAPSVDRAYVERLHALAEDFPAGARWMLFAFDQACSEAGQPDAARTTFHVPDAYAARTAAAHPRRFAWVASIHPYRPDALARLEAAISGGAVALKWLPSSMNIDLRDTRLRPFYERLAATRLPVIVHCGEERAVPGAGRQELGNPLLVRAALEQGVRIVVAHCASLGTALDLDRGRPRPASSFSLFARLMDEDWGGRLLGDVSVVLQANRGPDVARMLLAREDWHPRLLHGSDYPLPGIPAAIRLPALVGAGLLEATDAPALERLREHNPLLFDLALKRLARWRGAAFTAPVFATRPHFERPSGA